MTTLNSIAEFLADRPWIAQSVIGIFWISSAIVAVGKGQGYAVELAFWGMLFWALTEDDKRAYIRLLNESLEICRDLLKLSGEKQS